MNRVNAYIGRKDALEANKEKNQDEIRLIYDMSEFYDLWFAKEAGKDEKES